MRYIDRSTVIAEAYPGASNDIEQIVHDGGGWVCEDHPWLPWEGSDEPNPCTCGAPGMIKAEAIEQGLVNPDGSRLGPPG